MLTKLPQRSLWGLTLLKISTVKVTLTYWQRKSQLVLLLSNVLGISPHAKYCLLLIMP